MTRKTVLCSTAISLLSLLAGCSTISPSVSDEMTAALEKMELMSFEDKQDFRAQQYESMKAYSGEVVEGGGIVSDDVGVNDDVDDDVVDEIALTWRIASATQVAFPGP